MVPVVPELIGVQMPADAGAATASATTRETRTTNLRWTFMGTSGSLWNGAILGGQRLDQPILTESLCPAERAEVVRAREQRVGGGQPRRRRPVQPGGGGQAPGVALAQRRDRPEVEQLEVVQQRGGQVA